MQAAFGLRREECLKFRPGYADQGDHIVLKDSWTKGSRARAVPITTAEQRAVLDRAHRLAGAGSLIPPHKTYIEQRHTPAWGVSLRKGHHEPLISFETFKQIQDRIAGNARAPARKVLDGFRGCAFGHIGRKVARPRGETSNSLLDALVDWSGHLLYQPTLESAE